MNQNQDKDVDAPLELLCGCNVHVLRQKGLLLSLNDIEISVVFTEYSECSSRVTPLETIAESRQSKNDAMVRPFPSGSLAEATSEATRVQVITSLSVEQLRTTSICG